MGPKAFDRYRYPLLETTKKSISEKLLKKWIFVEIKTQFWEQTVALTKTVYMKTFFSISNTAIIATGGLGLHPMDKPSHW